MLLRQLILAATIAMSAVVSAKAERLEFSGPGGSIISGTIMVDDHTGLKAPWSVTVEGDHAQQIVLGLGSEEIDPSSVAIEVPMLVLVPSTREREFWATIVIHHGTELISTTEILIHRTRDRADLNADDRIDSADLTIVLAAWGRCSLEGDCPADLDDDGWVDGRDISVLVAAWHI